MAGVTVPNYGLLKGLADGLKEGLIGYQTQKQINRQQQMENLTKGVEEGEDGQLQLTPEQQQIHQLAQKKTEYGLNEYDPSSQSSVTRRNVTRGLLNQTQKGLGDSIVNDDMSAQDLSQVEGLIKGDVQGMAGMNRAMVIAGPRIEQVNTAKDNQSSAAVSKVTDDKALNQHTQRIQGANRIKEQLDDVRAGKIVDTNQLLNDLNAEYVNLLKGSNNTALGNLERTEYKTASGNIAAMMQTIRGKPESINSPEILGQLEKQVDSLSGSYKKAIDARSKLIRRDYKHNPDATKQQDEAIKNLLGEYGPQSGGGDQGLIGKGGAGVGQLVGPHGPSVTQGGLVYTWNPQTQKYESQK